MRFTQLICILGLTAWTGIAAAQFPNRPVSIVVPFPPGGSNDIFARAIGLELAKVWSQPVIIENRPGGGGSIGAGFVAKAAPDSYTFMLVSSTFAINSVLQTKLPYDPVKSFVPIALIGKGPMMFVAAPGLGVKSTAELIKLARSEPGKVTYASAGNGSINQMGSEMLASAAGVKLTHVPFKGGAQAMNDLLGNHVNIYLGSVPQVMPNVRAGKVVPIAVTSPQRSPVAPDVPTLAESLPNYSLELWWGIFGPAGMPREVVASINSEINKIIETPKMRQFLSNEAALPSPISPEQFREFFSKELQYWGKVAKDADIKIE
jgi:tripartite-type tricarboxylate transporter receptor subunit TctC